MAKKDYFEQPEEQVKPLPKDVLEMPIDVYLPTLEADEDELKPDQSVKLTVNGKEYFIDRGHWQKIPFWLYRNAKVAYPNISSR